MDGHLPSRGQHASVSKSDSNPPPFFTWSASEDNKANQDNKHYYEVIGECYVHGMMDGEAIEEQNFNKIPSRVFELR